MTFPFPQTARGWAILFIVLLVTGFGIYELSPSSRLKARHAALIDWARSGASGDFATSIASSSYSDQWGYTPEEVGQRVRAARFAWPRLSIEEDVPQVDQNGREATITQGITVNSGEGETRRFTLHCTWVRESFWPWSWKLRKVEAPDLVF
ncbi:MAG TPA: hypothetical protein VHM91_00390 [Verrucomicrobiales bacterium]|jgi:hypothetical protein|nr:hypothetical protein [Verrucomicrobiales bacterium]